MNCLERIAFRVWLGFDSVDAIDRWAEDSISASDDFSSEAYDLLVTAREFRAAHFVEMVRARLGFDPASKRGVAYAEEIIPELCRRVLDKSMPLPQFCSFITALDAAFLLPQDAGIPLPAGLDELWNACDWCDDEWTMENQRGSAEEIARIYRALLSGQAKSL